MFIFVLCFCRFLKGVQLGEQIVIEAKTNKCGKTLAFLDVNIIHKASGELVARGSHTKFIKIKDY